MAEYWKSTPKYWCKHCKTYVRDTAFERTQHEATGKHQGSLKRFLRDIHRNNERDERKNQRAKNEIERLKGVVSGSGNNKQDGGGGGTRVKGAGAATGTNAESSASRAVNLAARKNQMAQLVEMGVAIPEEFRGEMALAGDWKVVAEKPVGEGAGSGSGSGSGEGDGTAGLNVGVRKRKFAGQEEEEEAGKMVVRKGWGSTTRRYPGAGGGDEEDLDALLERTRELKRRRGEGEVRTPDVKEEFKNEADGDGIAVKKESPGPEGGEALPVKKEEEGGLTATGVKEEGDGEGVSKSIPEAPKDALEEPVPAVVFKKRKPKHTR
ncbi:hypothetical protein AJ79_00365 [Helicocarpus griseus UAMH5409]|uniref:U1-type domain-containing protein n=1 Tax=Helicocarpus griseus UAMH5409 TaxID=1447875 RepID=A0A2B7YAM7_9EURO|nr:hypothetical protein AJ79_00365 [Helicocarpus griseus UAMH5409]